MGSAFVAYLKKIIRPGKRKGENISLALDQTTAGRYLLVLFIYKLTKEALILCARGMAKKERNCPG